MVHYTQLGAIELFEGVLHRHCYPWHFHCCYSLVIVDQGNINYVFQDGQITMAERQVLIVNPFEAHYNTTVEDTGCSYRVIFLPINTLTNSETPSFLNYFHRVANNKDFLYTTIHLLFTRLKSTDDKLESDRIVAHLSQFLQAHFTYSTRHFVQDERIEPALLYINDHLDNKITINHLASLCNLSHYHFQRVFKKDVGLTVKAYIQQRRMELSRELLRNGHTSTHTSLETGYFDQSHFHRQFRKMWVLTPKELNQ